MICFLLLLLIAFGCFCSFGLKSRTIPQNNLFINHQSKLCDLLVDKFSEIRLDRKLHILNVAKKAIHKSMSRRNGNGMKTADENVDVFQKLLQQQNITYEELLSMQDLIKSKGCGGGFKRFPSTKRFSKTNANTQESVFSDQTVIEETKEEEEHIPVVQNCIMQTYSNISQVVRIIDVKSSLIASEKSQAEVVTTTRKDKSADQLHGVTLENMLKALVNNYGFKLLYGETNLRCFLINPTISSSLTILRQSKMWWAREKIEKLYLKYCL